MSSAANFRRRTLSDLVVAIKKWICVIPVFVMPIVFVTQDVYGSVSCRPHGANRKLPRLGKKTVSPVSRGVRCSKDVYALAKWCIIRGALARPRAHF